MNARILTIVTSALLLVGDVADAQSIRGDLADFSAGIVSRYSTKGHPKAGPVDLSIKVPAEWEIEEGEKPHIVQKMTRSIGPVQYSLTITITDAMEGIDATSTEDAEELFQEAGWAKEFFPAPAIVHSQSKTKFETQPAGLAEVTQFAERLGLRFRMRSRALIFLCENRFVMISGSVGILEPNAVDLDAKFEEARPLFFSILNHASLNNVWKLPGTAAPGTAPANPALDPTAAGFWPAFILALVLTWTIGPMPAVLLRFAVYKRPLPARAATIYAVAISVVFWILGMSIHVATDEPGEYRGIVWFIMYGVSRWILSCRGSTQDATAPSSADGRPSAATASTAMPTASGPAPKPSVAAPMTAIPVFESPVAMPQASGPPPARPLSGRPQPKNSPIAKIPRLPPPLPQKPEPPSTG
jgi:hypothetical protein